MTQDLAHKRPWLLASLLFGITYPVITTLPWPETIQIAWKMACVALLIPYALRRHHSGEFAILAVVLGLCSLGDGLVEFDLMTGGIAFAAAHIVAIWLYSRHRRIHPVFSQRLLAVTLFLLPPFIAYYLPGDHKLGMMAAGYTIFLSAMAAMAWSSNFPRYRVGMGAVLFVISDLLIFARQGPLAHWAPVNYPIWYFYYFGIVLIAVGIVHILVKRGPYSEISSFG